MIVFQSEITEIERRAKLLARIELEREIFLAENPHFLKNAHRATAAAKWVKNHPYLFGAGIAAAFVLIPRPRISKIYKIAKTLSASHKFLKFFSR